VRDDADLVAACLAGDSTAERALYDRHVDAVYRCALRLSADPDAAADITQETFIRAFSRLGQFRGESSVRTWLIAIVGRSAAMLRRKERRLHEQSVPLYEGIALRAGPDPGSDVGAAVTAAIAALPDKLRLVFILHDVEGYTHEEIAASLSIPSGTSKARLSEARAKLRAALSHHAKDLVR
jgi:RNA polymerase sigma-70 factor (ECF subfamily)